MNLSVLGGELSVTPHRISGGMRFARVVLTIGFVTGGAVSAEPKADEIMLRVAENQNRTVEQRKQIRVPPEEPCPYPQTQQKGCLGRIPPLRRHPLRQGK